MMKVLVVDDETVVRKGIVLGVDWASLGCVVVGEASNGQEGIEQAEKCQPNLIITDVRMPVMDGIEMMNRLRERGCQANVIVLTAYSDFDYARSALQFGASDYLLKPFRDEELARAIGKIQAKEQAGRKPAELEPLPSGGKNRYVMDALDYIAGHYQEYGIGITAIAEHLGVSEGHLSHVFKRETGHTVTDYLTQYRIHAAMKLLREKRLKIYEVAELVGYQDVAYFGSKFKKLVGVSASEYQNQNP